jgi:predicted PurR-regulated permease PerM
MKEKLVEELQSIRKILGAGTIFFIILPVIFLTYFLIDFLMIAFAGILLAVFLNGLAGILHSKAHISYKLSLLIVIIVLLVALFGSQFIGGPHILNQIVQLVDLLPEGIDKIQNFIGDNEWFGKLFPRTEVFPLGRDIIGGITGVFSNVFTFLGTVFIIAFVGIYLAVNPGLYIEGISALVPSEQRARLKELFGATGKAIKWWLFGRISSMVLVGGLTTIGLALIGMPLAIALGLIAALLSFIPYLGPVLSIIPALLIALMEKPSMILYVLILYSIIQATETYFITPLIQERAVSMPPALLIIMQILMGFLAGALGVLLATPLTVVIIVITQLIYVRDTLGNSVKLLGTH